MNRYQTSVIWLGLILIALNLITNYSQVKTVITNGATASPNTTSKTTTV